MRKRNEDQLRKTTEPRMHEARDGILEEEGFLGRIVEGSKWVSARIRGKR